MDIVRWLFKFFCDAIRSRVCAPKAEAAERTEGRGEGKSKGKGVDQGLPYDPA